MFNNAIANIYSSSDVASFTKSIDVDFQPYSKTVTFEDGYQIEITNRLFCDCDSTIDENSYVEIVGIKYKIIEIKKWDEYFEIYLYKLKRQV